MAAIVPGSEREVGPVAQRVEVGVVGRPLAHLRPRRQRGAQVLDRLGGPPGARLDAGEVVQRAAVAGVLLEALADQRLGLVELPRREMRFGAEAPLPGGDLVALAGLAADGQDGGAASSATAYRRVAGSGRNTSVPAGASSVSSSSVKRARPAITTYSSSWPRPSSVCCSITSSPAAGPT